MTPTTEHIDRRYSDEKAEAVPWGAAEARLAEAEVAVPTGSAPGQAKGDPVSQTTYRL